MNEQSDYVKFLNHLQAVWNIKGQCRELSKSDRFSDNDARNTFYRQVENVINDYFLGMLAPSFMKRLDKPFQDAILKPYFPSAQENNLFSNLGFLCEEPYFKTWHDMKKAGLVFSLWIVFEDTIDIIYQKTVTQHELESNQHGNYDRIKKIVEGKLNEEDIEAIKTKLKSNYIGINNKYNFILNSLSLDKTQLKQLSAIREFLQFFNILRNTLHTNSRPMKDYQFNLEIGKFKFEKNVHVDFFTLSVLYASINKIVDIFSFIRDNLEFGEEIFNPTTTVKSTY